MMNPDAKSIFLSLAACATVAGCLTALSGCGGEEEQTVAVAPAPPPPPPPPPAPTVTPIEDLMKELNIDQRVVLPEDRAPATDVERKAVLVFFDAFARGNSQGLQEMLPLSDQLELKALVDSGSWQKSASQIKRIEIQTGANNSSQKCALAVIEAGSGAATKYQPQLWYYTIEQDNLVFEAAPTPPGILERLSGDWIVSWHEILAAEMALAQQPDEDISVPQRNLDTGGQANNHAAPGGGQLPGGGRTIREPTGPPTPAP